jgi:hypothetical protein
MVPQPNIETWPPDLQSSRHVIFYGVFENRVLRRIFVRKRDKVTGEWRRLQSEELNDLYSSPNTECFINPSGISEVCSSGAKSHTGDESMSVKREHIQVLNLPYKCSICPPLVTRQTSIL